MTVHLFFSMLDLMYFYYKCKRLITLNNNISSVININTQTHIYTKALYNNKKNMKLLGNNLLILHIIENYMTINVILCKYKIYI